jgi:hypothetical protein
MRKKTVKKAQVLEKCAQNSNMSISVLLHFSNPTEDTKMYRYLLSVGFRVCRVKTLSQLHTILVSRTFDAIFLNERFIEDHQLSPARHLWEYRSPHTIIRWKFLPDGQVQASSHSIPNAISGFPIDEGHPERLERILEQLHRFSSCDGESVRTGTIPISLPQDSGLSLHRKLRQVLDEILVAGSSGIDVESLAGKIWGLAGKERVKDLQIYVCKLRKALQLAYPGRYRIVYAEKRYTLIELKP